jgi:hypothetical protein
MEELIYAPNKKPTMCIISNCYDFLSERKEWCGWLVFLRT